MAARYIICYHGNSTTIGERGLVHTHDGSACEPQGQALLGLATTRELLEEVEARGSIPNPQWSLRVKEGAKEMSRKAAISLAQVPLVVLDYRTVDGG
jgi:hypothetical protein